MKQKEILDVSMSLEENCFLNEVWLVFPISLYFPPISPTQITIISWGVVGPTTRWVGPLSNSFPTYYPGVSWWVKYILLLMLSYSLVVSGG